MQQYLLKMGHRIPQESVPKRIIQFLDDARYRNYQHPSAPVHNTAVPQCKGIPAESAGDIPLPAQSEHSANSQVLLDRANHNTAYRCSHTVAASVHSMLHHCRPTVIPAHQVQF